MKQLIMTVLCLLALHTQAFAAATEIPCVNEYCNGWKVSYEIVNQFSDKSQYRFYVINSSGITAHHPTCVVYFFDSFGRGIGSQELRIGRPMPHGIQFNMIKWVPKGVSKMKAEIYYKEEY